jgi:predicted LPLAT superfamily acyltransferase
MAARINGPCGKGAACPIKRLQQTRHSPPEMAPQAGLNLMPVNDIGPDTAILLQEKLDRGEWIAIVGDRIAVNPQRGGEWRVCG